MENQSFEHLDAIVFSLDYFANVQTHPLQALMACTLAYTHTYNLVAEV